MNVAVGIGDEWLESLKLLEAKVQAKREEEARARAEQIPDADYEVVDEDE